MIFGYSLVVTSKQLHSLKYPCRNSTAWSASHDITAVYQTQFVWNKKCVVMGTYIKWNRLDSRNMMGDDVSVVKRTDLYGATKID